MNVGRALELVLIVIIVVVFTSQAAIVSMRWHSTPHTQTLNRALAYYFLTHSFNTTSFVEFMLKAGGEDVIAITEYRGALGAVPARRVVYRSEWSYGYYPIRALYLSSNFTYVVVEVVARG